MSSGARTISRTESSADPRASARAAASSSSVVTRYPFPRPSRVGTRWYRHYATSLKEHSIIGSSVPNPALFGTTTIGFMPYRAATETSIPII